MKNAKTVSRKNSVHKGLKHWGLSMNPRQKAYSNVAKTYIQLESPYRTCPFKCPFCCSAFEGTNPYGDGSLYQEDPGAYFTQLVEAIQDNNTNEIIVTGMTEPTLFPEFVDDSLRFCIDMGLESVIQTMNHTFTGETLSGAIYDVVAYSLRSTEQLLNAPVSLAKTTRYVVVMNDEIDIEVLKSFAEHMIAHGHQVTIKYLANTSNGHPEVDQWIKEHRVIFDDKTFDYFKSLGVWVDYDCMNEREEKPVLIYRKDGKLYNGWLYKTPIKE